MRLNLACVIPLVVSTMLAAPQTKAQGGGSLQVFQQERNAINKTGMLVLGSWAVGNILLGAYGNQKWTGETKYFHQFNALWNVVNLGIASFGYYSALTSDPTALSGAEILKEYGSLQNLLLLNAGLDVAYMVTGLYLKERGRSSSSADRLKGYGNSLLLQGGFLLVFDAVLYFVHQHNASLRLYPYLGTALDGSIGVTMNLQL